MAEDNPDEPSEVQTAKAAVALLVQERAAVGSEIMQRQALVDEIEESAGINWGERAVDSFITECRGSLVKYDPVMELVKWECSDSDIAHYIAGKDPRVLRDSRHLRSLASDGLLPDEMTEE